MKKLSKILSLILILSIILSFSAFAAPTDTAPDNDRLGDLEEELAFWIDRVAQLERQLAGQEDAPAGTPVPRRPLIQVISPQWIEMDAGTSSAINFTLRNMGADGANAIVTTADLSDARGITGFFLDDNQNISSLGPRGQRVFAFQLTVNESVPEGFHQITFNHEFLNFDNERLTSSSTITVRVSHGTYGNFAISEIATSPSRVGAGDDFSINAVLTNDTATTIRDIALTITSGLGSDGVFLRQATNVVHIPNMSRYSTHNISIDMSASAGARGGAHPLGLELAFVDSSGTRQTMQKQFFVNIQTGVDSANAPDLIVTNVTRPTAAQRVGQEFEMVLTLQNNGANAAYNIRVEAVTEADRSIVPRSTSRMQVSRLEPGATRDIAFRFAATDIASTRSYDIGFTVSYDTGPSGAQGSQTMSFSRYQGVSIFNPDAADDPSDTPGRISTPRIIVSDFSSNPMIVQAGQEFELELTFLNTSSTRTVQNIKITLSVEDEIVAGAERRGSVFTPVGRSTFFIDTLSPREEVTETVTFFTLFDAPPRNYIINVNFAYEDVDHNPFEARESIGINVNQTPRLETSEFFIPEVLSMWSPFFFNFELFNTGRVTLNNLMIRIEGNFMASQTTTFFGNINPGNMDFFDNTLTPIEPGPQELVIVISFEDDMGELIEDRRVFNVEVFEPFFDDSGMDFGRPIGEDYVWDDVLQMFVPASSGLATWLIVLIAVGGAVIVAGVIVIVVIKNKKKKAESLDDFDE